MLALSTIEELKDRLGQELGVSDWHPVTQEDIDTLAIAPLLTDQVVSLQGFAMVVNQGFNRVRFPSPLPVGSQVRARLSLEGISERPGATDVTFLLTFECADHDEPVCVVESVVRVFDTR